MNRIRFTPQADRDFIEIYQYIASDNIAAADRHHELLRSRCLALVDQPRIGTKRDEIKPGLRSVAEGDYVIFIASRTKTGGYTAITPCKARHHEIDFLGKLMLFIWHYRMVRPPGSAPRFLHAL